MPEAQPYVFPRPMPAVVTKRYKPRDNLDLDLYPGERVTVVEMKSEWWAIGRKRNGDEGWIPAKHIRILEPKPATKSTRELYSSWRSSLDVALALRNATPPAKITPGTFPHPPPEAAVCADTTFCAIRKASSSIGLCWHDMHALLAGAMGVVTLEGGARIPERLTARWVAREKRLWHPDRMLPLVDEEFVHEARALVTEVFALMGQVEAFLREGEEKARK